MSEIFSLDLLPAVALVSVLGLEHAWHFEHFDPHSAVLPLIWYLGFYAVFTIFPFVFHKRFAGKTVPWATAALAGPLHFYLIYQLVRTAYPSGVPGLVPAAFALPALLGLFVLLKRTPLTSLARNAQLALFGSAALFFITLIFPIQFDRQWITVGWALEGAALCWLFHRVPHPRVAFGRRRFANRGVRSPGAQSSRAQLSSASGVRDFQLVPLHIPGSGRLACSPPRDYWRHRATACSGTMCGRYFTRSAPCLPFSL